MKSTPFTMLLPFLLLAGCGGGGGGGTTPASPATGRATVEIDWPARGRLVPLAANAIVATLTLHGTVKGTQVVARPSGNAPKSTLEFTGLRYGTYTVTLKATPNEDGSGVAQATGFGSLTVADGAPGHATVAHLTIAPVVVDKGGTQTLAASATDADGNLVLLAAGGGTEALAWSVDAPVLATLVGTGPSVVLTALHSGATTVRATLVVDDAGKRIVGSAPVTIGAINDGTGTVTVQ